MTFSNYRFNIVLVERNYGLLPGSLNLHFSDLDIDETTGIVLGDVNQMGDDCVVQNLVTRIAALSLKYSSCWLIVYNDKNSGW